MGALVGTGRMDFLSKLRLAAILIPILLGVRLAAKLYVARMRVRKLKAQGIVCTLEAEKKQREKGAAATTTEMYCLL